MTNWSWRTYFGKIISNQNCQFVITVRLWYFQPRPKVPWTLFLLGFSRTYKSSESVKKNIYHQGSERAILKKQFFFTKTCMLMALSCHISNIKFWRPDDKCFSWLILNCLMNIKPPNARESMELLV